MDLTGDEEHMWQQTETQRHSVSTNGTRMKKLAQSWFLILSLYATILASGAYQAPARANDGAPSLSGIIYRADGRSSAIFLLNDTEQALVSEGRRIAAGVDLVRVEAYRVLIQRAGDEIWLYMKDFRDENPQTQDMSSLQESAAPYGAAATQGPNAYRRRMIRLQSGLKRHTGNGRSVGYQLRTDDLVDVMKAPGLQRGDIIVSVNGNAFSRDEDLEDFAYDWRPNATYQYEVLRAGKQITID